jgi:hypothetical protein
MIVLQATGDIPKVPLWLGHATLTTTEICTRGDPTEKLDAMEAIVPPHMRRGTSSRPTSCPRFSSAPRNGVRAGGERHKDKSNSPPTPHYWICA